MASRRQVRNETKSSRAVLCLDRNELQYFEPASRLRVFAFFFLKPLGQEATDNLHELLWRFRLRRLTAEELRDSILALNGSLNLERGGPSVFSLVPEEALQTASRPDAACAPAPRRR